MNFKTKFKKNKGITLIALVVTIIVLLILAGISITMLTGQNGILNRTGEAKERNGAVQGEELIKVSVMDALTRGTGELTDENLKKALSSNLGTEGKDYDIVGSEDCGWTVTIKENDKDYKISSTGKIGEIEKVEGSSSDWRVEGNAVVEYLGSSNDIVVPNYVDGVKITEIGASIFQNSEKTGTLKISDGIKIIGENAFNSSNFSGTLDIPNTVRIIDDAAFAGGKFNGTLKIPSSVETIGSSAFIGCSNFTGDLVIPASVKKIESSAFQACSGFSGKIVLPENGLEIGGFAFCGLSSLTGDLIIPDNTKLGSDAFRATPIYGILYVGENIENFYLNFNVNAKNVIMKSLVCDYVTMQRFPEIESCWISSGIIKDINSVEMFTIEGSIKNKDMIIYSDATQDDSNWPEDWNPNNIKVVYDTPLDEYYKLIN